MSPSRLARGVIIMYADKRAESGKQEREDQNDGELRKGQEEQEQG